MTAFTREPSGSRAFNHRRLGVDAAPHPAHHPLDDLHQVLFVGKHGVGFLQPAEAFHVDLVRPVDHDVRDVGILHVRLQRSQPEGLGHQLVDQPLLVDAGEHLAPGAEELLRQVPDVAPQMGLVQRAQSREVERVDQLAVQARLELLEAAFKGVRLARLVATRSTGSPRSTGCPGQSFPAGFVGRRLRGKRVGGVHVVGSSKCVLTPRAKAVKLDWIRASDDSPKSGTP